MLQLAPAKTSDRSYRLCQLEEIPLGMGRAFTIGDHNIAVFRKRDGTLYATDNTCPHAGAPLSDGIIAGDCVVCPYHAYRFDLKSGSCDGSNHCVTTYRVAVHSGWIIVTVPQYTV